MRLNINDRLRLQIVERYHTVPCYPPQTVASHSYAVACIARYLAVQMGESVLVPQVMAAAIDHDVIEVLTGDLPSPAKNFLKDKGVDFNKMFSEEFESPVNLDPLVGFIVKTADRIETTTYVEQYGQGPIAKKVAHTLRVSLNTILMEMYDGSYVDRLYAPSESIDDETVKALGKAGLRCVDEIRGGDYTML